MEVESFFFSWKFRTKCYFLHEHDVVNVIDADDEVANGSDDDWVVNKFVFVVMNDMIVVVNEHVLEMMFDAYSIQINSIV